MLLLDFLLFHPLLFCLASLDFRFGDIDYELVVVPMNCFEELIVLILPWLLDELQPEWTICLFRLLGLGVLVYRIALVYLVPSFLTTLPFLPA